MSKYLVVFNSLEEGLNEGKARRVLTDKSPEEVTVL
jgi:hypothetical protein